MTRLPILITPLPMQIAHVLCFSPACSITILFDVIIHNIVGSLASHDCKPHSVSSLNALQKDVSIPIRHFVDKLDSRSVLKYVENHHRPEQFWLRCQSLEFELDSLDRDVDLNIAEVRRDPGSG